MGALPLAFLKVVALAFAPRLPLALPRPTALTRIISPDRTRPAVCKFTPAYEDVTVRYAAADWAKNLLSLPQSLILRRICSPLLANAMLTSTVCWVHAAKLPLPPFTTLPHTLLGGALSLLLVFRTNAAYDRFWEARKQWGVVAAECRALASMVCSFMLPQQAMPMLTLTAAFPVVMKNYLRGGSKRFSTAKQEERDARRLRSLLAPEEMSALSAVVNQPQYVLARLRQLGQASSAAGVTEKQREILIRSANVLGECVATCERIYNTPIPLAYSRHTSRFLVAYCTSLPLVLVHSIGWATLPVMAIVCWALFGILEIGNVIEEPFGAVVGNEGARRPLLPLTEVCRTIRRDVRNIAMYSQLAADYGAPTIERTPKVKVLPESFTSLREQLGLYANTTGRAAPANKSNSTAEAMPVTEM